jgi:lipoyl(octanoyl) transferase
MASAVGFGLSLFIWIVEHPAVFTQGISGKAENLLQNSNIPVVQSDRGGQITYHGPGQLLVYCLIDLKRLSIGELNP